MNNVTKKTKDPVPLKVHHVNYLRMGNNASHTPCKGAKGIHCTGDKFDFIVDWQVNKQKKATVVYD